MSCYLSLAGGENDQQLEQHQQRQKSRCFPETIFSSHLQYVFMDFNFLGSTSTERDGRNSLYKYRNMVYHEFREELSLLKGETRMQHINIQLLRGRIMKRLIIS